MNKVSYFLLLFTFVGCSSLFIDYDAKQLENKEFSESLKVEQLEEPAESETQTEAVSDKKPLAEIKTEKTPRKSKKDKENAVPKNGVLTPTKSAHEPAVEDAEGFVGRRPIVDPFVVGEELTYVVSYFAVEAGQMTMTTYPFVEVNDRKAYRFGMHARSSSVFSLFYAVDDRAETFLDYEQLIPYSYTIQARESKQIRDVKAIFNWQTFRGKTWDKKIKKGKSPEEKSYEWEILPYSQNVFSVAFYLRSFQFAVGKELSVRVAHEGTNMIMKAKVLREEQLNTPAGKFSTFVIKPEFQIDGVFKPVGDVFMWITNDQHHRIARIESKIKIGKIVVSLQKIRP